MLNPANRQVILRPEWATRYGRSGVIVKARDRLDAENSARLDPATEVVVREVSEWRIPSREDT